MSISLSTIKTLPDTPGVYFFIREAHDKSKKEVLYVGKATSLRDRVRSYMAHDLVKTRGPLLVKMYEEATAISFESTDSVLEALILEAGLIKKHRPLYNTLGKDDKSYNHVVITKEEYPRVFTVREKDLATRFDPDELKEVFGPFPHGKELQEALRIVRRIFPYRGEKDPGPKERRRVSSLRKELGLTPDFNRVSRQDYQKTIRNIKYFFEGKKKRLLQTLTREMRLAAKDHEFEKAEKIKRQIFALEHIRDVSLIKDASPERKSARSRVEGYDVAHTSEKERVGVMVVVEDGFPEKADYRKFKIKRSGGGDTGALKEILERRFAHAEWPFPRLIVVDGGWQQLGVAEKVLDALGYAIPVVAVTKGERHAPKGFLGPRDHIATYERDILLANAEAHRFAVAYHRKKRGKLNA